MTYPNARRAVAPALFSLVLLLGTPALAAGKHAGGHGHGAGMDIGQPADPASATRTVEVVMHDNYFEPETITVKAGETIRFKIRNAGALVHEFNIGTAAMHDAHQGEMMMMMEHGVLKPDSIDMEAARHMQATMGHGMHEEPNSVLLEPGAEGEIVWTFPAAGEVALEFGCNVPGHYASGMVGDFRMNR
ncbi:MAG: cupredoxin domain-containing protein [Alphaproteobacteria bacterium]|nr:cupredoxin domain-containing protein [Alphaproteobacteria bacterium]MDX5368928.1 cupredoxin domain-containing protein [Alphaproteobacteria bacterium]MDX5463652.1 cupredoxin domain-containing protein [Alphaproteobacteria bacterium]